MTNTQLGNHYLQGQKDKVKFMKSRKVLAAKASYFFHYSALCTAQLLNGIRFLAIICGSEERIGLWRMLLLFKYFANKLSSQCPGLHQQAKLTVR